MALQVFAYKVYNKTFLHSVKWLFSYSTDDIDFVNRFIDGMAKASFIVTGSEAKAVMMKKKGISILANSELIFINCSAEVYKGFEALKPELLSILSVLNSLGVKEIKGITCVKENLFKINKREVNFPITEKRIASILYKDSFADNPFFTESRDGIRAIVTSSFSDSDTESVIQMLVTVFWVKELSISETDVKIDEIDSASYDAWASIISDDIIALMES